MEVAIYNSILDTKFTRGVGVNVSDVGEISTACFNSGNGQYILTVAIYISPENPWGR